MRLWIAIFALTLSLVLVLGCTQDQAVFPDAPDSFGEQTPDLFLDLGVDIFAQEDSSAPGAPPPGDALATAPPAAICSGALCPLGVFTAQTITSIEDAGWDILEATDDSEGVAEPTPGFYGDPCTEDSHCRSDICGFDNTCVECSSTNGCNADQVCIQGQCEYPLVFGGDLTVEALLADPHDSSSASIHLVDVARVPEGVDPRDAFNTPADCFQEGCFQVTNGETSQQVRVIDHAPTRFLVGVHFEGSFDNHLTVNVRLRGRPGLNRSFEMPVEPGAFICFGIVDTGEMTWTSCGDEEFILLN